MPTARQTKTPPPDPEHDPTKTAADSVPEVAQEASRLPEGVRLVEGMDDVVIADRDIYLTRKSPGGRESGVLVLSAGATMPGFQFRDLIARYAEESAYEVK